SAFNSGSLNDLVGSHTLVYSANLTDRPTPGSGMSFMGMSPSGNGFQLVGGATGGGSASEDQFYYRRWTTNTPQPFYRVASREFLSNYGIGGVIAAPQSVGVDDALGGGVYMSMVNDPSRPPELRDG